MAVEANNIPAIDDDLDTTVPNMQPEVWKMPEPVFRKTSGRLPQGLEKYAVPDDPAHVSSPPAENVDPAPTPVEPTPKNPTLKVVIVALAIAAMVAFIVVFLTVVYFFFLKS